jgi:hypothetical protein
MQPLKLLHLLEKQYPGKVSIMVIKEAGIEGCHRNKALQCNSA